MDKIGEIFQKYVNLDFKDLIDIALSAIPKFMPALKRFDEKNDGFLCLATMITSAFGADGQFTEKEIAFLNALKIDADMIKAILSTDDVYPVVDMIVDSMDTDQKAAAMSFMVALCSLDERISPEENAFLRKLLA